MWPVEGLDLCVGGERFGEEYAISGEDSVGSGGDGFVDHHSDGQAFRACVMVGKDGGVTIDDSMTRGLA